ncbi:MAG: alkaline phosphatase [Verrucomicrobium sp.]|nr:alkaline phosphatase [Verrucomicrobium sp.]
MKWWVGLLALLVLVVFSALGMFYVRTFVAQRPHGIILFVANGLDLSLLDQARREAAARGQPLDLDNLNQLCVVDVQGVGQPIPDEAAAATALASGRRVRNGLVGLTAEQTRLNTLIYAAQRAGRATGLVTTRQLTDPTPLAFYGRNAGQAGTEQHNAAELIDTSGIDVILGGGSQYFRRANVLNPRGRTDERDLEADAARAGFTVVHEAGELNHLPSWRTRQLLGLFAPGSLCFPALIQGAHLQPTLTDMTRMAIKCLQYSIGGYFLVVDQGMIEAAARHNWTDLALGEVAALDSAVGAARAYAGTGSLVVVVSNYSLGALDTARSALASGPLSAEWLSGPGGPPASAADRAWLAAQEKEGVLCSKAGSPLQPGPAVRFSRAAEITPAPAWLGAGGFLSDRFGGFIGNDQVFGLLQPLF